MRIPFLAIIAFFYITSTQAAELFFSQIAPYTVQLQLKGTIVKGDYERLLSTIKNSPVSFAGTTSLTLSSHGGSVLEAMKIGELVEKASLVTMVNRDESCASSCFLIFVAGQMRLADGSIVIHRPYVSGETYDVDQLYEAGKKQRASTQLVRRYLEERYVPTEIIDRMMSLPSTKGYRLTVKDLLALGQINPSFEEASIAKCGASSDELLDRSRLTPTIANCIKALRDANRFTLLVNLVGEKQGLAAIREYANQGVQ